MSALSRNLGMWVSVIILAAANNANAIAPHGWVKIDSANRAAEKQANSFKDLLAVRQKAQLRKYPTNKALPLGEIRTYLEEVGIPPNLEERWVLAQFLSLNSWDLFGSKEGQTLFTGKGNENAILSGWIRKTKNFLKMVASQKKILQLQSENNI
jgi:hypothetical protein